MKLRIRLAEARDIPSLRGLIEASVRGLQTRDYSAAQLEQALRTVYGVDTQLIVDRNLFRGGMFRGRLAGRAGAGRLWGLEQAKDPVWRRPVRTTRRFVAGSGDRCGQDPGVFCASGMVAAGYWRPDSRGLRDCGLGGRVSAVGNGSDINRGSVLPGEGIRGFGGGGGAAGGRVEFTDCAHGETEASDEKL